MSHYNAFVVVMAGNIDDEEAARIQAAMLQMRGVLAVTAHEADLSEAIARSRAKNDMAKELIALARRFLHEEK